jgi:hypothetical protein
LALERQANQLLDYLLTAGRDARDRPVGDDDGAGLFESPATEVAATAETDPVPHGGDADDPAIWLHPDDPAKSTIIGTDKLGGIAVYDLAGAQILFLADGDLNNVDLRDGFPLGSELDRGLRRRRGARRPLHRRGGGRDLEVM